ncbi:MAG: UDP-glucose/GDP-mannose dehydrogenase family protein [Candidatus Lokiarchaeota archaeon]|nr:UDP-glucose/GDP-mannose dehydrogenase family protein [Candidatus Lokiarchaeota archaeon]
MDKPKFSIVGCGFVGLVTASCLASKGFKVIATTIKKDEADLINKGQAPFFEEGLDEVLKSAINQENLFVTLDNKKAILNTDITFISVGTPMREDDSINLNFIENVSKEIGQALADKKEYHLIVARSTIVPGTARDIIGKNIEKLSGKKMGVDFGLAMQPEFLREGASVYDTFHPNRIIIGELDQKSGDILINAWKQFYEEPYPPIERMNIESAEMVKYANNCFLSTKISFANEFARFSELIPNVDIVQVMKGIGLDDRINPKFLGAGVGFGGSCFHKDVSAIKRWGRDKGFQSKVLEAVLELNNDQAIHIVDIAEELVGDLKSKRITLLGLSFKPGTDDMREAPSLKIIKELQKRGVSSIVAYDPRAESAAKKILENSILYANSIEEALRDSECALLVTEWEEFKSIQPQDFQKLMKTPNLVDGRRIYDHVLFSKSIPFRTIGRR